MKTDYTYTVHITDKEKNEIEIAIKERTEKLSELKKEIYSPEGRKFFSDTIQTLNDIYIKIKNLKST